MIIRTEWRGRRTTNRSAILRTIKIAPGLWIHIIGILNAPTILARYVWINCGAYCIAASKADETPRKVAHFARMSGSGTPGAGEVGTVRRRKKDVKVMNALSQRMSQEVWWTKTEARTCEWLRPRTV